MEAAPAPQHVQDTACAVCGAGMRPDAPWCTLCLTPVATAPAVPAAPRTAPAPSSLEPDPLTAPLHLVLGEDAPSTASAAGWPCTTCGGTNAFDDDRCASCGKAFLSGLADSGPAGVRLPVVGDLRALTPLQRVLFNATVGVAVLGLMVLLGLVTSRLG